MNDIPNNHDDVQGILENIDTLLDELDDIVEHLEVYYAGMYSAFIVNSDDLE